MSADLIEARRLLTELRAEARGATGGVTRRLIDASAGAIEAMLDRLTAAETRIAELTAERDRQYDYNVEQVARIAKLEAALRKADEGCRFLHLYDEDDLDALTSGEPK